MKWIAAIALSLPLFLVQVLPASSQDLKKWNAQIAQHKRWLDTLGPDGQRYWIALDESRRPHRLYLGEGFFRADYNSQERFVETYSIYIAGHPEKYMLMDLFDARTRKQVGEFGWGGFKLYRRQLAETK